MNELEKLVSDGIIAYIDAKIDLNKPNETLEMVIPGYCAEKFDLINSFSVLSSIFNLEIPFIVSDLLHLIKKPIFYQGNLVMKINGNLVLLRPTMQSLFVDLQHLKVSCRKSKSNHIEKAFLNKCFSMDLPSPSSWSPAMELFRKYAIRRLREKVNMYIAHDFIRDEVNNSIRKHRCHKLRLMLNPKGLAIRKPDKSNHNTSLKVGRCLQNFIKNESPMSLAKIAHIKREPSNNVFEICCYGEGTSQESSFYYGETLNGISTKLAGFLICAQAAQSRLKDEWLPPDMSFEYMNFNVRLEEDESRLFWLTSLDTKLRIISPHTRLFIGNVSNLSDCLHTIFLLAMKNGIQLKISLPKESTITILPYWLQSMLESIHTYPEISIHRFIEEDKRAYIVECNCMIALE